MTNDKIQMTIEITNSNNKTILSFDICNFFVI